MVSLDTEMMSLPLVWSMARIVIAIALLLGTGILMN
jgi:hypothetical protein